MSKMIKILIYIKLSTTILLNLLLIVHKETLKIFFVNHEFQIHDWKKLISFSRNFY